MASYKRSVRIPIIISLFLSLGVLTTIWLLKDSSIIQYVLEVTLLISLAIFILSLIYFLIAQILLLFNRSVWLSGLPIALLIYFGVLIITISYFNDLADKMPWDVGMVGLGVAVVTIGMSFLARYEPPQPEEIIRELKAHSDDLGDRVASFSYTQSNLENLIEPALEESQRFLESLTKIIGKPKRR